MIFWLTISIIVSAFSMRWLYQYGKQMQEIQNARENVSEKAFIAVNIWACRKSGKRDETGFSEAMDELHRATAEYLALDQEETK